MAAARAGCRQPEHPATAAEADRALADAQRPRAASPPGPHRTPRARRRHRISHRGARQGAVVIRHRRTPCSASSKTTPWSWRPTCLKLLLAKLRRGQPATQVETVGGSRAGAGPPGVARGQPHHPPGPRPRRRVWCRGRGAGRQPGGRQLRPRRRWRSPGTTGVLVPALRRPVPARTAPWCRWSATAWWTPARVHRRPPRWRPRRDHGWRAAGRGRRGRRFRHLHPQGGDRVTRLFAAASSGTVGRHRGWPWNISGAAIRQPDPASRAVRSARPCWAWSASTCCRSPSPPTWTCPSSASSITQPGAAPARSWRSQVTKKVEDAVANVTGVKHVHQQRHRRPQPDGDRVAPGGQQRPRPERREATP